MKTNRAGSDSAVRLRTFLRERRARIHPEELGLPARRPRGNGLRRQDVAELIDVSPLWYGLFESATSERRFSAAFLERVQEVLRIEHADRAEFIELVVITGNAAPEVEARWHYSRWQVVVDDVAATLHKIDEASTLEVALALARESLQTLLDEQRAQTVDLCQMEVVATFGHPNNSVPDPSKEQKVFSMSPVRC